MGKCKQKILEAENNIGDRLPLKCEVHGNTTFVASSRDFDKLQVNFVTYIYRIMKKMAVIILFIMD